MDRLYLAILEIPVTIKAAIAAISEEALADTKEFKATGHDHLRQA